MDNFGWADGFTFAFILLGLFHGVKKGLMRELAEVFEALILIFVVFHYRDPCYDWLAKRITFLPEWGLEFAALISLGLAAALGITVIDKSAQKLFHTEVVKWIRVPGGMLLGALHFTLLWAYLCHVVVLMPIPKVEQGFYGGFSYTGKAVFETAPAIHGFVMKIVGLF